MYPNMSNDQQFRINKINEVKDYFIAEIRERELMSKNLSKYTTSLDYLSLFVLSVATGSISIASSATVIVTPAGIMSAGCSLTFSITTGFVKAFLRTIKAN